MKKLLLLLVLLLTACVRPIDSPTLHVFYSKTCSECQLMEEKFIPLIKDVSIELHDIDDIKSVDLYKTYLKTLKNIDESLYDMPITPFIYMEKGFGAIGYNEVMNDIYIDLIEETLEKKEYTIVPSGVWICKEE